MFPLKFTASIFHFRRCRCLYIYIKIITFILIDIFIVIVIFIVVVMSAIQSLAGFTHVSFDIHRQNFSAFSVSPHSKIFVPFVASIQGWDPAMLFPGQFAFCSCNIFCSYNIFCSCNIFSSCNMYREPEKRCETG